MVYVHIILIFHGNIHGNNWNLNKMYNQITTTYRRSNTKTCFGRSTKSGPPFWGADPLFSKGPLVSASIQKQSNTLSMIKVSCRRAAKNIAKKLVKFQLLVDGLN